jgi:hypothetical protein
MCCKELFLAQSASKLQPTSMKSLRYVIHNAPSLRIVPLDQFQNLATQVIFTTLGPDEEILQLIALERLRC